MPHRLISIVIPVFNEEGGLHSLAGELLPALGAVAERFEVILVDDGSSDRSWEAIAGLAREHPAIRGIRLSRNFGKESALCAGIENAAGDAVIVMDADLQHPVALIARMVEIWRAGEADVVEAVKFDRGTESLSSRLRTRMFYALLRLLSGMNLDGMSDFKLLDRRVVNEWLRLRESNRFFRGMVAWLGFRHVAIPFSVPDRASGASGWSVFGLARLALGAITSFSTLPLHFSTACGAGFAVLAFALGVQTLYNKWTGVAVEGFTTVILLLLIIGSAMLLSVGVIGEYIARIYHEVKARPVYIVSATVGSGAQGVSAAGPAGSFHAH